MASSSGGDDAVANLTDAAGTSPEEMAKVMADADAVDKPAAGDGENISARQMISAMHKASDGTNVFKESMISFSSASIEGVTKKGDLMHAAKDMPGCLALRMTCI